MFFGLAGLGRQSANDKQSPSVVIGGRSVTRCRRGCASLWRSRSRRRSLDGRCPARRCTSSQSDSSRRTTSTKISETRNTPELQKAHTIIISQVKMSTQCRHDMRPSAWLCTLTHSTAPIQPLTFWAKKCPPVTPAPGNVYTDFVFYIFSFFELGAQTGQTNGQDP